MVTASNHAGSVYIGGMTAASSAHMPRLGETAEVALENAPRIVAEMMISARQVLQQTADQLLAAVDREQMVAVLEESLTETLVALRVVSLKMLGERPYLLLQMLQRRGVEDSVVERVRLGLLAADDEAALLSQLPGGLDFHSELAAEDAKSRLLLMAIIKWAYLDTPEPIIWSALTFEFLDTAGRAYGLASAIVGQHIEDVA
jgi:hypothetical protein